MNVRQVIIALLVLVIVSTVVQFQTYVQFAGYNDDIVRPMGYLDNVNIVGVKKIGRTTFKDNYKFWFYKNGVVMGSSLLSTFRFVPYNKNVYYRFIGGQNGKTVETYPLSNIDSLEGRAINRNLYNNFTYLLHKPDNSFYSQIYWNSQYSSRRKQLKAIMSVIKSQQKVWHEPTKL